MVIENDGEYKEVEYPAIKPVDEMTKEEILNAIGNAGVVGMGEQVSRPELSFLKRA